jgi:hypothetical protein
MVMLKNGSDKLIIGVMCTRNLFGGNVNQDLIQSIMDGMVAKTREVDGQKTSLCDLGRHNMRVFCSHVSTGVMREGGRLSFVHVCRLLRCWP